MVHNNRQVWQTPFTRSREIIRSTRSPTSPTHLNIWLLPCGCIASADIGRTTVPHRHFISSTSLSKTQTCYRKSKPYYTVSPLSANRNITNIDTSVQQAIRNQQTQTTNSSFLPFMCNSSVRLDLIESANHCSVPKDSHVTLGNKTTVVLSLCNRNAHNNIEHTFLPYSRQFKNMQLLSSHPQSKRFDKGVIHNKLFRNRNLGQHYVPIHRPISLRCKYLDSTAIIFQPSNRKKYNFPQNATINAS